MSEKNPGIEAVQGTLESDPLQTLMQKQKAKQKVAIANDESGSVARELSRAETPDREKRANNMTMTRKDIIAILGPILALGAIIVTILIHLNTRIDNVHSELKSDIGSVRLELKSDIDNVRTELKSDIDNVRTELKSDIDNVRTELKSDIDNVRTELKSDINNIRTELKGDIEELSTQVGSLDERVSDLDRKLFGIYTAQQDGEITTDELDAIWGQEPASQE